MNSHLCRGLLALATSLNPRRAQVRDDLATLERQVSDLQTEASTPTNELVDPS